MTLVFHLSELLQSATIANQILSTLGRNVPLHMLVECGACLERCSLKRAFESPRASSPAECRNQDPTGLTLRVDGWDNPFAFPDRSQNRQQRICGLPLSHVVQERCAADRIFGRPCG